MLFHGSPKIIEACPMPTIKQSVHKLRRKKNIIRVQRSVGDIIEVGIVFGVCSIKALPGMHHKALLRIVPMIVAINAAIPSAFVAIAPNNNRRMVHIANHHFFYNLPTNRSIISPLPPCELVNYKKPQ